MYISVVPGTAGPGITKRWGYFDQSNGLFWQELQVGGTDHLQIVVRSSVTGAPVDTIVDQAAFNGTALPGSFSLANASMFGFDFQWLGTGRVRCFLMLGGLYYIVHTFDNTALTSVWMSNPNLPFRMELINGGTGGAQTFEVISVSQMVETYSNEIRQFPRSGNRGSSQLSITNDGFDHALIAIRIDPTQLSSVVQFNNFNITVLTGTVQFLWKLISRGTVAGPALVWVSPSQSLAQYAVPVVANTVTGGNVIASEYGDATNQTGASNFRDLPAWFLGSTILGTPLELILTVSKLDGGGSDDFVASMNWIEYV
jgi:hypothetical protein